MLSTESKRYWRETAFLATKYIVISCTMGLLAKIAYDSFRLELLERGNPTPADWSFWTRCELHVTRVLRAPENGGMVDWARTGTTLRALMRQLEDPEGEGKDLLGGTVEDETPAIPGVGRVGWDISAKSWPWRSCYFEVVMGCATAAERLENKVVDLTRRIAFPKDTVIGPSNPDPRPVPSYSPPAPLEENCAEAFEAPEIYYLRVITGKGFETWQRLDAAQAYANWLEYKGLQETAREVYRWSLDIALEALPQGADRVVDESGALRHDSGVSPTPNLLRAATDLAIHHSRTGDVATALPIFLSLLRARRASPVPQFDLLSTRNRSNRPQTDIGAAIAFIRSIFAPTPFPPPPPTGDEPFSRRSEAPDCGESELMVYIGEILFAAAGREEEGLAWTRSAVQVAEANAGRKNLANDQEEKKKCKQCLLTGVRNWELMLQQLVSHKDGGFTAQGGWRGWLGWLGLHGRAKSQAAVREAAVKELEQAVRLRERVVKQSIDEEMANSQRTRSGFVWIK